jgi:dGTPase
LANLPLLGEILSDIAAKHPRLEPGRQAHELIRRLITLMIEDVIAQSRRRIVELEPDTVVEVRGAGRPVVSFSEAMAKADRAIKGFLLERLYRHARIVRIMDDAEELVGRLFGHYETAAGELPADWLAGLSPSDATGRAVRIVDFIAGMTDRYAMVEHSRIFGATPELM